MSTTKHFINDPSSLVSSALRSTTLTNPSLSLDLENKIVYCKGSAENVAIISGGGAGHEPSFVGFVGPSFLRAAVSGTIFASPSVSQIHTAITHSSTPNSGILLLILNYTGDVLHFGLALEKTLSSSSSSSNAPTPIEMVVVGDDVGVGRAKNGKVGRRGIAGTVLVAKIAGALAGTGAGLKEVADVARLVARNLVSVGSSLAHVHVPGHAAGSVEHEAALGGEDVEIGMGIHNEQGFKRIKIPELPVLVEILLKQLLDKRDEDRAYLEDVDEEKVEGWVLLINNLGGVSPLEMGGITAEVVKQLEESYDITPKRVLTGTFMTSLNGNGFSITLLRLLATTNLGPQKSMLNLLDAPHGTTSWPAVLNPNIWEEGKKTQSPRFVPSEEEAISPSGCKLDVDKFSTVLTAACKAVSEAEAEITNYDDIVGDGDCGLGLKRGADAVVRFIEEGRVEEDAVVTIMRLADIVERNMDGTSGAIYSIFLTSLSHSLRSTHASTVTLDTWATAALGALVALRKYTPAQPGDRTLVDALQPFVVALKESGDLKTAAKAARKGAEGTRGMKASLGRTVYVSEIGDTPDPGAMGVAVFAEGLAGVS